jgi:hypothetical protein
MMQIIIVNSARCKKCDDVLVSKHVHDFVTCQCGSISVDGGLEYIRRCGNLADIEELSEMIEVVDDE